MIIGVDKNQKKGKHETKHRKLNKSHELLSLPLPVGDYVVVTEEMQEVIKRRGNKLKKMDLIGLIDVSVDTKQDCRELYSCLVTSHERFADSCLLAKNNNIKLYILVENKEGFKCIDDIKSWANPQYLAWLRKNRQGIKIKEPVKNITLIKIMYTMEKKYGVKFLFCSPYESAEKIVELLTQVEGNSPTPFPDWE